jgi:hypothetical protein
VELYKEFRMNEPWDSPHNIQLLRQMPIEYAGSIDSTFPLKDGYTCVQAPSGKQSILTNAKTVRFADVTDGTSNTIVVLEVDPKLAKPWTAPEDYPYDPKDPLAGVAKVHGLKPQWIGARADGSVMLHSAKWKIADIVGLFTMDGGELFSEVDE